MNKPVPMNTEGLLMAVIESSNDAIISKTLESIITSWNPAAEKIFGYTAEEAIGQSITMLIPQELRSEEDTIIQRIKMAKRFHIMKQYAYAKMVLQLRFL